MCLLRQKTKLTFKVVVNVHVTIPIVKKDYLINFLAARLLKHTDHIVFISKNQQAYLTLRFLLHSPCAKHLIYNGIDTNFYSLTDVQTRNTLRADLLNIKDDRVVFIKVAGIRLEKDHETALRALRFFIDKYSIEPLLVFAGDGKLNLTNTLKQLVKALGLTKNVIFTGFTQNVREYLACADLFTLTSNSVETFSLAALEAMACGLPAVLTDIGGASEMLNPKVNGLLTAPANYKDIAAKWHMAITNNYDNTVIRNYIISNFDLSKMNSEYFMLFNEII
jgi:glycosyltransferase involved in cell wall biosynthesis